MDIRNLEGSIVALVTPFKKDGSVDFDALERLIDFHLQNGTDAILTLGTTGESATMTDDEDNSVVAAVVKHVAGRVPVIAGSGSNSTQTMLTKSLTYQGLGADGLLLITPYYNKSNEEGIYQHFKTVADAVDIPCILYNIPGRCSINMEGDTTLRLAHNCDNVVAIKEASGNISQVAKIAQLCGDELNIYSGNDDQVVPLLSLGGKGVISVVSNVKPELVHNCCKAWFEGDPKTACKLQLEILPLADALFCEVNPIPVKYAMNVLGWEAGSCRLPLVEPSDAHKEKIEQALAAEGLIRE